MLVGEKIYGHRPEGSIWNQSRPPMLIGGLSLQWVLFTVSILEIVPLPIKLNMKTILLWIARNLGVKQALVLANVCILKGHIL
jgi:hypothetical protein